jgi:hypothetical protein
MRYTVIHEPSVDAELARIWIAAPDKWAVTQASHKIDARLTRSPLTGTAVGDEFHLRIDPLEVTYKVIPDDCKVLVEQVVYRRLLSP